MFPAAAVERVADQFGAGVEVKFALDVRAMRLDRACAQEELLGDLGVGVAERDQPQDVALAGGASGPRRPAGRRRSSRPAAG